MMTYNKSALVETDERKPIIDTGREMLPLKKYPQDLDFTKTVSGTTYMVNSHFNREASECLFIKVSRLLFENKNLAQ